MAMKALALDLMRDSVFIVDEEGRIVDANEAAYRTRGYARHELLSLDLRALATPDFAERVDQRIAEVTSVGEALFESAHRRKDGSVMPVEISSRAIEIGGRRLFVGTVRDITRRKASEKALGLAADELQRQIDTAAEHNRQISCLAQMGRELEAYTDRASIWPHVGAFLEQLFPQLAGEVLELGRESRTLRPVTSWGPKRPPCGEAQAGCAVLYRERAPFDQGRAAAPECGLNRTDPDAGWACIPILASGEPLGVLRIWGRTPLGSSPRGPLAGYQSDLAEASAEQISVVLVNLDFRKTLADLAMRDPLTGLHNRRFLEEALMREVARARREKGSLGVLMLDLDHFKDFNDSFGHEAGDNALRTVGDFLKKAIRTTDVVCRYGGEEFTILLPGATLDEAYAKAEQIRIGIRATLGSRGNVAACLGVAVFPGHGDSPNSLLRAADTALYRAKALGRDRVETFDGS